MLSNLLILYLFIYFKNKNKYVFDNYVRKYRKKKFFLVSPNFLGLIFNFWSA